MKELKITMFSKEEIKIPDFNPKYVISIPMLNSPFPGSILCETKEECKIVMMQHIGSVIYPLQNYKINNLSELEEYKQKEIK